MTDWLEARMMLRVLNSYIQAAPSVHFGTRVQSPLRIIDDSSELAVCPAQKMSLLEKHDSIRHQDARAVLLRMSGLTARFCADSQLMFDYLDAQHLPQMHCNSRVRLVTIVYLHSNTREYWGGVLLWLKNFPNLQQLTVHKYVASVYDNRELNRLSGSNLPMVYVNTPAGRPLMKYSIKTVNRLRFFVAAKELRWCLRTPVGACRTSHRATRSNSEPTGRQSASSAENYAAARTRTECVSFCESE